MSEEPKCYTAKTPTAKKQHRCCECRGSIFPGEKYHVFSGVWDTAHTYKTCDECEQLRADVVKAIRDRDEYPAFGDLYQCVFEGRLHVDWVKKFMATRRKRNAPESPNGWMERRESECSTVSETATI